MIDSSASCYACPVHFLQANLHVRSTCFMGRKTVMSSLTSSCSLDLSLPCAEMSPDFAGSAQPFHFPVTFCTRENQSRKNKERIKVKRAKQKQKKKKLKQNLLTL